MQDFHTPILFLIYRNPEATKKTFAQIKKIRPPVLYIAADGAQSEDLKGECLNVRRLTEDIDWECKVYRRYLEKNKGCKLAVSSAISWFFEKEEYGIILEYDCLPHLSFFYFCEQMLEKYATSKKIMQVGGANGQDGIIRGDGTYYFSAIAGIWGWATWRRAWKYYDENLTDLDEFLSSKRIKNTLTERYNQKYWIRRFKEVQSGVNNSSWGIPWAFSVMNAGGYCITPNTNLISNIGFGERATHGLNSDSPFANLPVSEMTKIVHPSIIAIDHDADNYAIKKFHKLEDSFKILLVNKIKRIFHIILPKKIMVVLKKINRGRF